MLGSVPAKKLLTKIPVRKPDRQEFVRVHPSPDFRGDYALLTLRNERETYLVTSPIAALIPNEIQHVTLFLTINRQAVLFLWPVPLPNGGRANSWHETQRDAAFRAMKDWVRVQANMSLGGYEVYVAEAVLPNPEWPIEGYDSTSILKIAFARRGLIDDCDHPALGERVYASDPELANAERREYYDALQAAGVRSLV